MTTTLGTGNLVVSLDRWALHQGPISHTPSTCRSIKMYLCWPIIFKYQMYLYWSIIFKYVTMNERMNEQQNCSGLHSYCYCAMHYSCWMNANAYWWLLHNLYCLLLYGTSIVPTGISVNPQTNSDNTTNTYIEFNWDSTSLSFHSELHNCYITNCYKASGCK